MTIVKQISLFDIQELFEMESSHRFDAIFATFDVQPIFQLFSEKTMRGAPRECNYGAMIQSLIIRIVERILTVNSKMFSSKFFILPRLRFSYLGLSPFRSFLFDVWST